MGTPLAQDLEGSNVGSGRLEMLSLCVRGPDNVIIQRERGASASCRELGWVEQELEPDAAPPF
jgi:hypothetical protein